MTKSLYITYNFYSKRMIMKMTNKYKNKTISNTSNKKIKHLRKISKFALSKNLTRNNFTVSLLSLWILKLILYPIWPSMSSILTRSVPLAWMPVDPLLIYPMGQGGCHGYPQCPGSDGVPPFHWGRGLDN